MKASVLWLREWTNEAEHGSRHRQPSPIKKLRVAFRPSRQTAVIDTPMAACMHRPSVLPECAKSEVFGEKPWGTIFYALRGY
jgi:hypothetical protein